MKSNKKGFTLVELIVVISILAVLALILVPSIIGYTAKAKDAVGKANAKSCYSQLVAKAASDEAFGSSSTVKITIDSKCTWKDVTNKYGAEYVATNNTASGSAAGNGSYYYYHAADGNVYHSAKTFTAQAAAPTPNANNGIKLVD